MCLSGERTENFDIPIQSSNDDFVSKGAHSRKSAQNVTTVTLASDYLGSSEMKICSVNGQPAAEKSP